MVAHETNGAIGNRQGSRRTRALRDNWRRALRPPAPRRRTPARRDARGRSGGRRRRSEPAGRQGSQRAAARRSANAAGESRAARRPGRAAGYARPAPPPSGPSDAAAQLRDVAAPLPAKMLRISSGSDATVACPKTSSISACGSRGRVALAGRENVAVRPRPSGGRLAQGQPAALQHREGADVLRPAGGEVERDVTAVAAPDDDAGRRAQRRQQRRRIVGVLRTSVTYGSGARCGSSRGGRRRSRGRGDASSPMASLPQRGRAAGRRGCTGSAAPRPAPRSGSTPR